MSMEATAKETPKPITQQEACEFFVVSILTRCAKLTPPRWCFGSILFERGSKLKNGLGFRNRQHFVDCVAGLVDRDIVVERRGRSRIETDFAKLEFRLSRWFYNLLKVAQESVG